MNQGRALQSDLASKADFQSELKQPGLISREGLLPARRQIRAASRITEARRIGQVEDLGAESKLLDSVTLKLLMSDMSSWTSRSPRMIFRPALP